MGKTAQQNVGLYDTRYQKTDLRDNDAYVALNPMSVSANARLKIELT